MNLEFPKVTVNESSILRQLLELYCYDFSEYLNTDVDPDGHYHYKYLDLYWKESGRHAFFIEVDQKLAGFILINQDLKLAKEGYCISEFFILKKYRKKGIGTKSAHFAFDQFIGPWEVSVITSNKPATLFWQKAVDLFTRGKFKSETGMYNNREKLFLTFNS